MQLQRQLSWHLSKVEGNLRVLQLGQRKQQNPGSTSFASDTHPLAAISTAISRLRTNVTSGDVNCVQAKYELVGKASVDVTSVPSMSLAALHPGHATAVGLRSPCCGAARAPFTTSTSVSEPKSHALKAYRAERPLHHAPCLVSTSHAAVPAQRPLRHCNTGVRAMC
jgi:hypothetical protein